MRTSCEALKAVYGPSLQIQAHLRSSDGSTLLTDKEVILQRWSVHFEGPLQWPTHCAGVLTSQDSPGGGEAGAG